MKNIQIPRCLRATAPVREVTLHTFVDASQEVLPTPDISMSMELLAVALLRQITCWTPTSCQHTLIRINGCCCWTQAESSHQPSSWHQERRMNLLV